MSEILNIPLTEIKSPSIIMSLVNKDSLAYLELRESIKTEGLLQNLTVKKCPQDVYYAYELVTGLKRYTIAKDLGLEVVPCIIVDAPSSDMIIKQIQENCCRQQPSNLDLSLHFKRLMLCRPDLTFGDLAMLVHKSPEWVKNILTLQELIPAAKSMMENNEMPIESALVLAKLPSSIQYDLLDSAVELKTQDFLRQCRTLRKAYKAAARQGRVIEWEQKYLTEPVPEVRSMMVIKSESTTGAYGEQFIKNHPNMAPLDIWKNAMLWILQLDPQSVVKHHRKLQRIESRKHTKLKGVNSTGESKKKIKQLKVQLDTTTQRLAEEFFI